MVRCSAPSCYYFEQTPSVFMLRSAWPSPIRRGPRRHNPRVESERRGNGALIPAPRQRSPLN